MRCPPRLPKLARHYNNSDPDTAARWRTGDDGLPGSHALQRLRSRAWMLWSGSIDV